jgi:hypothetical protein
MIKENRLVKLEAGSFAQEKINEVSHLQKYIANSISIIDPNLYVITTEFNNFADSKRRIDLLCIDKEANFVVIELKRTEDGGHMELQAIRYAAMVAGTKYKSIIDIHKSYLQRVGQSSEGSEERILKFLEWQEPKEQDFGSEVKIILISADFSVEITTSVLWLNQRDLDIRCIRLKPQKDGDNLYFDIQQIIPLPEAADFQIKQKEKASEERMARREDNKRDHTKYDIIINGVEKKRLNKREAIYFVIEGAISQNIKPEELYEYTGGESRWISVNKSCQNKFEFEEEVMRKNKKYDGSRWFNKDQELFKVESKTYAFSNQHGGDTKFFIQQIFDKFRDLKGQIEIHMEQIQ